MGKTSEEKERHYTTTLFPKNSLMDALRIAESIKDNNAGNPYDRLDLARSLNYSPNSSTFRTLITSSAKFGLTTGSYSADKISLTPSGVRVVSPTSDEEYRTALREALFNVSLFEKFFTKFDKNKVPREDLLRNTLVRDFGVPAEDTKACYEMLLKNAKELGITTTIKGVEYFQLANIAAGEQAPTGGPPVSPMPPIEQSPEVLTRPTVPPQPAQAPTPPTTFMPRVFVSHSKNRRILAQIKDILDFGQFEHRVAVETETTAIPIPEKVFGLMRECNCAIINVSADEAEKEDDNSYGVNPNVLTEIGSAFLAYNKRVILLADRRVKLPSNLQGLSVLYYQGDELDFDTVMKLQRTLTQFRKGLAG